MKNQSSRPIPSKDPPKPKISPQAKKVLQIFENNKKNIEQDSESYYVFIRNKGFEDTIIHYNFVEDSISLISSNTRNIGAIILDNPIKNTFFLTHEEKEMFEKFFKLLQEDNIEKILKIYFKDSPL